LTAYGASANGGDWSLSVAQYAALFQEQLFVHVMSLDFLALWALSPWVKRTVPRHLPWRLLFFILCSLKYMWIVFFNFVRLHRR
jgi:hypothetical protein